ncbi:FecR domain-containing protein [Terrimonas sp. NA20]|uniref:FecR domain-containing protein n=1 Tax=Terrimonas ginsenosidimutans TaxID=2908004 RepID=A0ABS9KZ31_9BACT|nr:FecR domain-containing protein [Terrimonas ginsenosidimutans]MCG2617492.1 FecR domain-containing protein [Terrimonas ginsenosidimutans]
MQNLQLLIQKCWSGTASSSELNELLQQLDKEESKLFDTWMQEMPGNTDAGKSIPVFDKAGVRELLLSKISVSNETPVVAMKQPASRVLKMFRISAAVAAVCLLMVLPYQFLFRGTKDNTSELADAPSVENIILSGDTKREVLLKDGSTVLLYEQSSLRYDTGYNSKERKLTLKGKARFTVSKDKNRPFIVFSGPLSTTALGTIFEVTEDDDSTIVCLMEGSVKVQNYKVSPFNTVYLVPGQKAVNKMNAGLAIQTATSTVSPDAATVNKDKTIPAKTQLTFRQTPLENVFRQLEKMYAIRIKYYKADISGKMFTGTFDQHESCADVLQVIGNLNNLEIISGNQEFIIKK